MKEKHNTDKIFHLLQMDGVSPITKRNIQETLLQEFRASHAPEDSPAPPQTKKPRAATSTASAAHNGSDMDMHFARCPLVAEDFVCCKTTHASTSSDDKESSITRDPDSISKALI
jgi:hypothetical protein